MTIGKWKMETLRALLKVLHLDFPFSICHLSFVTSYLSDQRLDRFELWRVGRPHHLKQRHLERAFAARALASGLFRFFLRLDGFPILDHLFRRRRVVVERLVQCCKFRDRFWRRSDTTVVKSFEI